MASDRGDLDELNAQAFAVAMQLPAVVWTTDRDLKFTSSVGGGLAALGLAQNEVVGMSVFEYFRSEDPDFEPIRAHVRALDGESVKYETQWAGRRYETHTEPFRSEAGEIIGTLGIALDVTERKNAEGLRLQLQVKLRDQQKLEAIGQLAGGVAHEINNPIQSIMNFAQLMRSRASEPSIREYAEEIQHEAQRVASIVRNLQTFARQADEMEVEVRVAELVERTMSLFGTVLGKEGISVDVDVPEGLPVVWCRPQGVQQVLVNLLTNAREALNDRYPGEHANKRIVISATRRDSADGTRVRLSVEDHGTPIEDEAQDNVFEPFTTLKGRDQGSGLALSIARGIARDNNAALTFEATAEHTVFHLDVPVEDG
ncbi:MAG: ATP-binding protein [Myxococcales bacterium]|nr:ATP-binding protein [Myxococcales bacterium]